MISYYAPDMRLPHNFAAGNRHGVNIPIYKPFMVKAHIDAEMPNVDALVCGHHPEQVAEY